jgi:hypothetical protein
MSYSLPTIHYRFDVDGTNSGTLGSALNITTIPSGILFDSANKKIGDKCISILNQTTGTANRMTVPTWTTPTNFTISVWARVISRVGQGQALMEWTVGGNVFALIFWDTTTNFLIYYNSSIKTLTIPNMYDNAYHHYLFTVASNGDITMYIDNISQGSVNHSPSPTGKSVSPTYIGSRANTDPVINGYIDDFKIYDYIADSALRNVIYKLGIGTSVSQLISEGATPEQIIAGGGTFVVSMSISSTTVTNGSTTNNASIALTFTSSVSTSNFVVGDISVTNGTLSGFASSSTTVYNATFTPAGQGLCTINVPVNKFSDASGNFNAASNTFNWTFDAAPSMIITSTIASGSTTNIASIPLTFTASEAITGFQAVDISFNKGTLTGLSGSGSVYTATFTQGGEGAHIINVPVGVYIDASGNANTTDASFNWTYDSVQPTMEISANVANNATTNNASIALTFTSSKPTSNFVLGDISFNKGSLTDLSGSSTVYTATFTPNGQGAHTINVAANKFTDSAGNNNTASNTFNWNYDSVSPSMTITSTTPGVTTSSTTNNASIALTFTSTETTNNFAVEDISVTNGSLSAFAASSGTDGKVYTATFTPTTAGLCTIGVAAGVYTDAATNLNNLATQFTWTFDNVAPTMTITSTTAGVVSGSTIDNPTIALTFTSSKATNNFAVEDISVTNGTLSNFNASSGTDGKVYTATFTPAGQGTCTINVASGAYTDAVGNNNAAANTFSVVYIPKFALFNNANNLEQTYITGFLDVSGIINHRTGDLNVIDGNLIVNSGNVSLNSGNLNMGGNVSINSGLIVNGPTTLQNMTASGNIDVSGATTLVGAVSVSGSTTFNNNVSISNNKKFTVGSGTTVLGGDVSMNSALRVAGDVSLNSTLAVNGLTTLANTSIAGTLVVNGKSTFTTDMSFTAVDLDICGNLRAQYPANSIPLAAIVGGGSLTATDVSMNAGLNVAGATTLSTLTANGHSAIGGALAVTGASTLSALTATGAVTLGDTIVVTEKTVFATDVSFNGSRVDICGNFYANYPANSIPASAIMSSISNSNTDVSMNAKLSVAGATTLASTLVVAGKTTFLNDVSFGISGSRVDICGNLYANYAANSIPNTAIIGGIGSVFNADVSMNARLSVKNSVNIDTAQMQYKDLWSQLGGDIDGQPESLSGMTVSLSNDGSRVAIGNKKAATPVRVYTRDINNANGWSQLGGDISIFSTGNTYSAHNVVLSGDGSVVAVNTYSFFNFTPNVNRVMVFQYQSGSWVQLGTFSPGGTRIGIGIALSYDGLTLTIGTPYHTSSYTSEGMVHVYKYTSAWNLYGNTIYGGSSSIGLGWSLALSSDGNTLAVGAILSSSETGQVRVYNYISGTWTQIGSTIAGGTSQRFGYYVSLSADGTILAASTGHGGANSTYARVYRYNGSAWTQIGNDFTLSPDIGSIDVLSATIGVPIALSRDGTIFAIGSYINDGTSTEKENNIGATFVYRCPVGSSTWTQIGTILGERSGDFSGISVSLSENGSVLAIGAINNDGTSTSTTNNSGQVRVYNRGVRVAPGLDISANVIPTSLNSADLNIGSTLNVSGSTALAALTSRSTNVGGTLRVTGATTTATLVAGNTNIGGTLYVTGATTFPSDVSINSTLTVASDVSINSPLFVGNDTTLNSTLFINRDISLNSTLFVNGATTLAGVYASTLSVTGATTMADTAYVTGNSTIGGVLAFALPYTFAGDASLNSKLTVARDVSLNSTLNVTGATTVAALTIPTNMTLNSTLSVTGATTIMTDVSANARLVTGAATLNSTMYVATTTNLAGTLQVTGATTVPTLTASGATTIGGTLTVNGKTSITGNVTLNSNTVDVSGNLRARSLGFPSGSAVVQYKQVAEWLQMGNDINGEATTDESGISVSLSANGLIVAIGAHKNDGTNTGNTTDNRGHVRVYQRNATNTSIAPIGWTQLGGDIDGESQYDYSGSSVSLSADGLTVAIGATYNDGTYPGSINDNRGHVRVYQRNTANTTIAPIGWTQVGGDIDGDVGGNLFGFSVNLSADGSIVSTSSYQNDGTYASIDGNANIGRVKVYRRNTANATITPIGWTQLGGDINGEAYDDTSGTAVSILSDGTNIIVAIGAAKNDGTTVNNLDDRGHVRVYKYDANKNAADTNQSSPTFGPVGWNRLGADIDGEAAGDNSGGVQSALEGNCVALAGIWPNVIVAIGARTNDGTTTSTGNRGHVRVYQYVEGKEADTNQSSSTFGPAGWKRLGQDIDGEAPSDSSGWSVALSADGYTVAIGANGNDGTNPGDQNDVRGHVRVYKYELVTSNTWSQLGQDIDGEVLQDQSGRSVSLSADGSTLAVGAMNNDGNGSDSGHVRVFKYLPIGLYANTSIVSTNAITTGNVTLYDACNVARATSLTGTLSVAGASTVSTMNTSSNTSVGGALTVTGATTSGGALNVSGATTSTTMTLSSNAVIGGTLVVSGAATMQTLNLTGPIKKI